MDRCSLCNGRIIQTEFGSRCMNNSCENSKEGDKKAGHLCLTCNEKLIFRRNNAYGERTYWCPDCQKETTI